MDAQWTMHDPRDTRQKVHGRSLDENNLMIIVNPEVLINGSNDGTLPGFPTRMSAAGFLCTRFGPVGTPWEKLGVTPDYFRIVEVKLPNSGNPRRPEAWAPVLDRKALQWSRTGYLDYALHNLSSEGLDQTVNRTMGVAESWLMVQELEREAMRIGMNNFRDPTKGPGAYCGVYEPGTRAALFCHFEHLRQVREGWRPFSLTFACEHCGKSNPAMAVHCL